MSAAASSRAPDAEVLHPLRFALAGSSLIEASAGTGKTFTIAMLYVRAVLGHGSSRPLTPPEILVVTFTDAATKELRERIRARLVEAAACFGAAPDAPRAPGDALLRALRDEYAPDEWPACARRLRLAAEWMDEAAVSTIHGWCNRMLSEHAFASDSLFSQTLVTDQRELRALVVRDYWRTFLAPLDSGLAAVVRGWFADPDALQGLLRGFDGHAARLPEVREPQFALRAARDERDRQLAELKAPWPEWIDSLRALVDEARAKKQFDGRKLQPHHFNTWMTRLLEWATTPDLAAPAIDAKSPVWTRLTPDGIAEIWKGEPPAHPAFDALATLRDALATLADGRYELLCHAARWVERRFAEEETRRSQMGFDDLLTRLDAALRGANGPRLAELIRAQYPVALIDEFQDTDPVQYAIFDAVYRIEANDPDIAIVLIGDPKQAIYAFRGADIFTYLAARRACAGRRYTLATNFRSTAQMVDAVNHCFSVAEARDDGAGAFLFRGADRADNPLPFVRATANGRAERFVVEGEGAPALTVWRLPWPASDKPCPRDVYLTELAARCATEIVRLLSLGQAGRAGFAGAGGLNALRPADFAVLVNNGREAAAIRAALSVRGVRSVYLSERDSVFASAEARVLRCWLAACAEPEDGRLVRAALATAPLGLGWAELDALTHDELAWEQRVLQFRAYRDGWRSKGVLPMLRRLLNDFGVPQRLLDGVASAAAGGERALTNLLHLAELLQHASVRLDGEHALLRYLDEQLRDSGGAGNDALQLRLESDAGLVQVVTVHKSKGLEYPLVFLPFACSFRATKETDVPLKWHDANGELRLGEGDADTVRRADRERLGEDLRKLYVALTRARYATWVGIAPIAELEASAFGYLLAGGRAIAPGDVAALLDTWRGGCESIRVDEAPPPGAERFVAHDAQRARGAALTPPARVREPWWIASYSSLGREGAAATVGGVPDAPVESGAAPDTRGEDVFHELLAARLDDDAGLPAPSPGTGLLHDFPRGADAGTFLHELMEWAAGEGFGALVREPGRVRDTVARRCNVRGWERWIEPLTAWLLHLLSTPLRLPPLDGAAVAPFVFARLGPYMAEMEFWFAAHAVDTRRLDELVARTTLGGVERPALAAQQLNGMLKGFIDLVFEHEGRYYVADYKSNWLGAADDAYTEANMRRQILHARYELQYVLYLFALHRLLKVRIPDYDYDRHVGGAVYLFLRGSRAAGQGLHVERVPRTLIDALDALFEGADEAHRRLAEEDE